MMAPAGCGDCSRCRFARLAVQSVPGWVDGVLARALTVEASKMYAALHYRAELDEHSR